MNSALKHLKESYLNLELAIKIWSQIKSGKLTRMMIGDHDGLEIGNRESGLVLPPHLLKTEEDFLYWSENNITIGIGVAAISLWESVLSRKVYNPSNLPSKSGNFVADCAVLSYMIRCCFAHGITEPRWAISTKYKRVLNLGNELSVDLSNLNKELFNYSQIGEWKTMWILRDRLLEEGVA